MGNIGVGERSFGKRCNYCVSAWAATCPNHPPTCLLIQAGGNGIGRVRTIRITGSGVPLLSIVRRVALLDFTSDFPMPHLPDGRPHDAIA